MDIATLPWVSRNGAISIRKQESGGYVAEVRGAYHSMFPEVPEALTVLGEGPDAKTALDRAEGDYLERKGNSSRYDTTRFNSTKNLASFCFIRMTAVGSTSRSPVTEWPNGIFPPSPQTGLSFWRG
jgi:hypothetical protein